MDRRLDGPRVRLRYGLVNPRQEDPERRALPHLALQLDAAAVRERVEPLPARGVAQSDVEEHTVGLDPIDRGLHVVVLTDQPPGGLPKYFEENVIGGPGAFLLKDRLPMIWSSRSRGTARSARYPNRMRVSRTLLW